MVSFWTRHLTHTKPFVDAAPRNVASLTVFTTWTKAGMHDENIVRKYRLETGLSAEVMGLLSIGSVPRQQQSTCCVRPGFHVLSKPFESRGLENVSRLSSWTLTLICSAPWRIAASRCLLSN